ncbi:acyl-CoA dehydrogenase family protein [Nocardioides sp. CER19]|uniref:acyl-CoA dehydrogenase family protein n=1 Tax=Nocardioides sp. CER19 TaxID=3038538 RepID=UPI00244B92F1|nr:acyl-CoA dehydrogenase family protein [Nocardioides sp. CER19]MDH2413596.1 acyl-CoA dehydrogenase family protein [Nocardioides sp. CER19]
MTPAELRGRVEAFLAEHPPATTERSVFLHARYAAGLAWVHFPEGHGGLGLSRGLHPMVEALFAAAGAPDNNPRANGIGLGMVAPTLLAYGSEEQCRRYLEPLWCGEEIWCQLFSEPGAGSDLAGLATRAVPDGDSWVVNGQKVWTSGAHNADLAILVARTDPDVPKHRGITYFLVDMKEPGVDVRPLRQITGEAEFNEVFLTDVRIPDAMRVGDVGDGWRVANGTLNNERVAIGGHAVPREGGMLGVVARSWRDRPEQHTPELHDRLMRLWVETEVARLTGQRLRQQLAAGQPGPAGAAMKLTFARLHQQLTGLDLEIRGEEGLRYESEPGWDMVRPSHVDFTGRDAVYRYLRAKGNSIEGGTSEILRNIVAERVLGLPAEPRVDKDVPWKEVPR